MNKQILNLCLDIAREVHDGQIDKMGDPYIWHPIAVANKMTTDYMKCIALLHDVLEDSELTADDLLEKGVPKCIVYKVQTLTKAPEEKYMDYIKRVKKDPVCALVKIADIEHNLDPSRFLTDWYAEKRRGKYRMALKCLQK